MSAHGTDSRSDRSPRRYSAVYAGADRCSIGSCEEEWPSRAGLCPGSLFLDTGVRVSELIALRLADLDLSTKSATVEGIAKRAVQSISGKPRRRSLEVRQNRRRPPVDEPVFQSERGEEFTRSGVQQLIRRLGVVAGITGADARRTRSGTRSESTLCAMVVSSSP